MMDVNCNIVLFITDGDSNNINTWSNVPYYFSKALEKEGYKVIRINVEPKGILLWLVKCFAKVHKAFCNLLKIDICFGFKDTKVYRYFIERKIKTIERNYSDCKFVVSMDYNNIIPKCSLAKVILVHDWSLDYYLYNHKKRKPYFIENCIIKRQHKAIAEADVVISLFPAYTKFINEKFGTHYVKYLGHVINSNEIVADENFLNVKFESKEVLFIGRKNYYSGACSLINAIKLYNLNHNASIKLSVIGMTIYDFPDFMRYDFVRFLGYLDKGNWLSSKEYYDKMNSCKCVVNTTENWAGASSLIEAMYHYNPVIISEFEDFLGMFGDRINFGLYCKENTDKAIEKCLDKIFELNRNEYFSLCINAHERVEDFSWSHFVKKMEDLL